MRIISDAFLRRALFPGPDRRRADLPYHSNSELCYSQVSTDLDDPPSFLLLNDDALNLTSVLLPRTKPYVREYYEGAKPIKTTLPIGAAFIRALTIAEERGLKIVTPVAKTKEGYVEPEEWMNKDEVAFEARCIVITLRK